MYIGMLNEKKWSKYSVLEVLMVRELLRLTPARKYMDG